MKRVVVSASFDDLRSGHMRFLHEASRYGGVTVVLWSDEMIRKITGEEPKLSQPERFYLLDAVRYVDAVVVSEVAFDPDTLPEHECDTCDIWIVDADSNSESKKNFCDETGIEYAVITPEMLKGFPSLLAEPDPTKKTVVVTGCYDWFHSGHVRFFEEVSEYGNLYVVVGHDENVRLLKGEGHPLFPQEERRYVVQSIRYVTDGLVSTGTGWMDAEPEIKRISADIYAVNDDGDQPEKRQFCEQNGLEYLVLKREPKEGLTRRTSTNLRGY